MMAAYGVEMCITSNRCGMPFSSFDRCELWTGEKMMMWALLAWRKVDIDLLDSVVALLAAVGKLRQNRFIS